jgi:hypothetical protein
MSARQTLIKSKKIGTGLEFPKCLVAFKNHIKTEVMKPLIIIYSTCLIGLYTVLAFTGVRHEKRTMTRVTLPELVVHTSKDKLPEATALSKSFDKAIYYMHRRRDKQAAQQVYDAVMILAIRTVEQGNYYDRKLFRETLDGLSENCVKLAAHKKVSEQKLDKLFETAELFAAQSFIEQSYKNIDHNRLSKAMRNINQAEECIVSAASYADRKDKQTDTRLFNSSRHLLNNVIGEREDNRSGKSWRQMRSKLYEVDGRLEGPVTI